MCNTKILNCPCCDSEIKGGVRLTGYYNSNTKYIKCDCCGLKMESKYIIDGLSQTALKKITMDLIRRWNTRKPVDAMVERLNNKLKQKHKLFLLEDRDEMKYFYEMNLLKEIIKMFKKAGGIDG